MLDLKPGQTVDIGGGRCAPSVAEGGAKTAYPWQALLDVQNIDASQYHEWARTALFELFKHAPARLLDVGCGAGTTGEAVKKAYPGAMVFGIELNEAAAEAARTRVDKVATGRFEEVDLEALGIAPGSLDTVILADVLEHLYDPWSVLLRLRPYLTADAQIIASIPNVRNLALMEELARGNWRYEECGLLDVTHIRFFTLREIYRFFHETGYRITNKRINIDKRLAGLFNRHIGQASSDIRLGRMTLTDVTPDELGELCAIQFFVRAEPGAVSPEEFASGPGVEPKTGYARWQAMRQLKAGEVALWKRRLAAWAVRPQVHFVVAAAGDDGERVVRSLEALFRQGYEQMAVTVVAACPPPAAWQDGPAMVWREARGSLMDEVNAGLSARDADWMVLLDAGDTLAAETCWFMLEAAQAHPEWLLIYSDEDSLFDSGECGNPHFKSDFDIDLLRSYPYVGGALFVARDCFRQLQGYDARWPGLDDYDLVLRAVERFGEKRIGHVAQVLLHRMENGGRGPVTLAQLNAAAHGAVAAHLARLGIAAEVGQGLLPLSQRVNYRHAAAPLVSILIAARAPLAKLQRALESLLGNTRYTNFELLVLDAGSDDAALRDYVSALEGLGDPRIKAFRSDQDGGLSASHNLLAAQAQGEYLLFLQDSAAALQDDWLDVLMAHAQRAEVGAVGPRLLNADGSLRGGLMVLGLDGSVGAAFRGLAIDDPGYFGRALVEQRVSAIASGVLLTRRATFAALGGFVASHQPDAAAADYCLRLAALGLKALWTPHASLLCEAEAPAAGGGDAADVLAERWLPQLARDPCYNPHLKLTGSSAFACETGITVSWDRLPWKPLPRVLALAADVVGCGQYRILAPMRALTQAGRLQGWSVHEGFDPVEVERMEVDSLVFQRQIFDRQIASLARHRRYGKALRIFELDDLLDRLPERSVHREAMPQDIAERLRRAIGLCDRLVVSTEPMAAAYRELCPDIRVVANYLERQRWGNLRPRRRQSTRPRVGWVGGSGHGGDLAMMTEVMAALSGEVDWVLMGMRLDAMLPHLSEYHDGVLFDAYADKVSSLNLDLAIAPLEDNPFNEAKSNLRLLEYGILGFPVICSDVYPYRGDLPVTRVRNRTADWIAAIREHIGDLDQCAQRGDALRQCVSERWMLEDHLTEWAAAWLP